jgi:hypothetical protein
MRRGVVGLLVMAVVVALGVGSAAREAQTVTGEVVDLNCYLKKGEEARGEPHKQCAVRGARRGDSLGIIAADGVYAIAGEFTKDRNAKLIPWVALIVDATGAVAEVEGRKIIDIATIKAAK